MLLKMILLLALVFLAAIFAVGLLDAETTDIMKNNLFVIAIIIMMLIAVGICYLR